MTPETRSLVEALWARPDLTQAGRGALARAFPEAPPAMLDTAAFHLFTDGCTAAFGWLASLERFLRQPENGLDSGATWHLLYHLYNWQQVEALLPFSPSGLAERLTDAKQFLSEGDLEAAERVLTDLQAAVNGELRPPKVE